MLSTLKTAFIALAAVAGTAGIAAADHGPTVRIGAQVNLGSAGYATIDYRHGYGPGYVIPSVPSRAYPRHHVAYPQHLRPRRGYTWVPAHYEHRYGRAVWVPGHWQRVRPRRGFVWVEDHVEYRHGRAVYVPGHWERVRRGHRYYR